MIGDQSDFFGRIKALLPSEWFGDVSPVRDAFIQAPASMFSTAYGQIAYARQQTRIKTATGAFLDIIGLDFFGGALPRLPNELDPAYLSRIQANLFANGPTRADMSDVLTLITGRVPVIFEPQINNSSWDAPSSGWDITAWGDTLVCQAFVTAFRPPNSTLGGIVGWDSTAGGWDVAGAQQEWVDMYMIASAISDAAILAAIAVTTPLGIKVWATITDNSAPYTLPLLGSTFVLGTSQLS